MFRVTACTLLYLACAPPATAVWELRRNDADTRRPAVVDGIVSVDAGDPSPAFPRYLTELGVKTIRIRFTDAGLGKRRLSVLWNGGSQGPDRFSVRIDGAKEVLSRMVDTAARPYDWNRDDFIIALGAGRHHTVEIATVPDCPSSIEFAGIRLAEATAPVYQPLCYESIGSLKAYRAALGGEGMAAETAHVVVFAPKDRAAPARRLSAFLEKAYGEMRKLYGVDPAFRFSVEHYPTGHKRAWGGISGAGTIGYSVEALDRFAQMGTSDVRGFAGYTEEMSHGFKAVYKCSGTYEALGVAVQEDVVRRLAPPDVADRFWLPEHRQWDETHRAYLAAGRRNPDEARYPNSVLYTRILNDIFLRLRTEYGPRLWPDFFAEMRRRNYPLLRAKETERMAIYADSFSTLMKRDMRAEFEKDGIDLNADPPWGWQTHK